MKTKEGKNKKFLALVLVIMVIVSFIIFMKFRTKQNEQIRTSYINTEELDAKRYNKMQKKENEILKNNVTQDNISNNIENKIITDYKGYPIIAKLEIPKIELETYVISEYSKQALEVSVTKFFGSNPNEVGNFCIAGHNYITKNMFHNLKKLSIGDTFYLTDTSNKEEIYKIYLVETVEPYETQCLSQKTNGKTEVTLITCTTDSTKRIIVKAVKI